MASEKILIVDDDEDVLLIVQTILDNAGYTAILARNGREGVEKAIEAKPDLILLDVMMPELSGWEVCTTLKSAPETRPIPIAMLTVKSEIRDLITGMQVGADDYITKPFTRKKLLSTVRRLLDEKRESPPSYLTAENEEVRFRNLLFDAVTELPTVPVIVDALRDRLLDNRDMGVLYIDVEQYSHIEETYGWEVFDSLLRHTARTLRRMFGTIFATEDFVAVNRAGGSDFYVFATLEGGEDAAARLQRKARQVEDSLRGSLDEAFGSPHPQAHRRLRRARAAASEPADAHRAPRVPRARAGDHDRDDEGRGAPGQPARDVQGHPAQEAHPDGLPADLPDRDHGALRARGPDARPARDGVREPGAALPVRGRARGDLGARADLPGLLGLALRARRARATSSSTSRRSRWRRWRARGRRRSRRSSR